MRATRHESRGTTFVPLAMDITRPSALLIGPDARRHAWARWGRPLLIVGATVAALALLIASRPW